MKDAPMNLFAQDAPGQEGGRKSEKAYKTISEAAKELNVATHVLRFWESKFTQIKPLKRGGGRRYYDTNAMQTLHTIKRMLHDEGYTIKGLQSYFEKGGVDAVVSEVRDARSEMEKALRDTLAELKDLRSILHA